jgi:predicted transposase/invertase (TIGR01784 family)
MEVSMKDTLCSPLYDFVFKEVFGKKQNLGNTRAFLKTLLDIPEDDYDRLTIENTFLPRWFKKGKEGVVDVKLTTKSGKIIHIELQVEKASNMRNRILYYGARLIGDQLKMGDDYNRLHQTVSIIICDHVLLEEESSYMNVYELRNERNNSFTDMMKVVILELPKLTETEDRAVVPWLRFLKCKEEEDFKMLLKKYPQLQEAVYCIQSFLLPRKIRDEIIRYNLWKTTQQNIIEQARIDATAEGRAEGHAEGRAEGHAEGRKAEKFEIARKMKTRGRPLEEISADTGLSIEDIEKLN